MGIIDKLLSFSLLVIVCSLRLQVSPHQFSHSLNALGGSCLYSSLDYHDVQTRTNIVRFLDNRHYEVRSNFAITVFTSDVAKSLIENFIQYPEIHHLVLPFSLFSWNKSINEALNSYLDKYQPGPLLDIWTIRSSEVPLTYTNEQIMKILAHQNDFITYTAGNQVITVAYLFDLLYSRELYSFEFSPHVLKFKLDNFGSLPITLVSILHDSVLYRTVEMVLPQLETCCEPNNEVVKHVLEYMEKEDWMLSYGKLLKELQLSLKKDDKVRQALWEGKLLYCAMEHSNSTEEQISRLLGDYLQTRQVSQIPVYVLLELRKSLIRKGIALNPSHCHHFLPKLREIDVLFPFGRRTWGDLKDHAKNLHSNLRLANNRVVSFDLSPGVYSVKSLILWWGNYLNLSSVVLFDISSFRAISVQLQPNVQIHCSTFTSLLKTLTSVIENEFISSSITHEITLCQCKAFARILVSNIIYRHELGFKEDSAWIDAFYDLKGSSFGDFKNFIFHYLQQANFDWIPKHLLAIKTLKESATSLSF